jgi:putative membrane protein
VESVYLLLAVMLSSMMGAGAGFLTGLVPGLHVNNLAAMVVAGSASVSAFFVVLGGPAGEGAPAIMVACFLVSSLVSHMFSEAIVSTYLGIPSGDTVSVLPAHRLARSGLGRSAVRVSAQGSIFGVLTGVLSLPLVCVLLGPPVDAYSFLKVAMGFLVACLSAVMLAFEGVGRPKPVRRMLSATAFFFVSGLIGVVVLDTNYFAAEMPDLPWMTAGFVDRSSLLLPMFAGLFGVPTVLLSLDHESVAGEGSMRGRTGRGADISVSPRLRDMSVSSIGGLLVGWIPGMTSGSSATVCSSGMKRVSSEGGSHEDAARFIWLYSAISSCGAVLSVGALFTIARARSGIMQAVDFFFGGSVEEINGLHSLQPLLALLLAMVLAAVVSHHAMFALSSKTLERLRHVLCSRNAALASMGFVTLLVLLLTGTRGGLILVASASLGLLPPSLGLRRINLMGCLLVPISITFILG